MRAKQPKQPYSPDRPSKDAASLGRLSTGRTRNTPTQRRHATLHPAHTTKQCMLVCIMCSCSGPEGPQLAAQTARQQATAADAARALTNSGTAPTMHAHVTHKHTSSWARSSTGHTTARAKNDNATVTASAACAATDMAHTRRAQQPHTTRDSPRRRTHALCSSWPIPVNQSAAARRGLPPRPGGERGTQPTFGGIQTHINTTGSVCVCVCHAADATLPSAPPTHTPTDCNQ